MIGDLMADDLSPDKKAFNYAQTLGVDTVYENARERHRILIALQEKLMVQRKKKRELEAFKIDREMELASREAGANPSMSAAAMKEHLKIVYHTDKGLEECRRELMDNQSQIDALEFDISQVEIDIKINLYRLYELGGYFNYLAQIYRAREAKRSQEKPEKLEKPEDPENPWR